MRNYRLRTLLAVGMSTVFVSCGCSTPPPDQFGKVAYQDGTSVTFHVDVCSSTSSSKVNFSGTSPSGGWVLVENGTYRMQPNSPSELDFAGTVTSTNVSTGRDVTVTGFGSEADDDNDGPMTFESNGFQCW